jgi:hypothetical protein
MDGCLTKCPYMLIDIGLVVAIEVGMEAVSIERDDSGSLLSKRHRPSKASDSSPRWSVQPLKNLLICLSLKVLRSHALRWQKIKNFETGSQLAG